MSLIHKVGIFIFFVAFHNITHASLYHNSTPQQYNSKRKTIDELKEDLLKHKESENNFNFALTLYKLGEAYINTSHLDSSIAYFDEFLDKAAGLKLSQTEKESNILIDEYVVNCYEIMCRVFFDMAEYKKSVEMGLKAYDFLNNRNEPERKAKNIAMIGYAYFVLGEYDQALKYFQEGLNSGQSISDSTKAEMMRGLGFVHRNLFNHEKAIQYFSNCIDLLGEKGNYSLRVSALNEIGNVYFLRNEIQTALRYRKRALKIAEETKNEYAINYINCDIGNDYIQLKNFSAAIIYYKKALQITRKIKDLRGEAVIYVNLGNAYLQLKDYSNSEFYLKSAYDLNKRQGLKSELNTAQLRLAELYKELNEPAIALAFYEEYMALKDSLLDKQKSDQIAEMEAKFDSERKTQENELLRKEKKLKDFELTDQINFRNYLILISVLITVSLFILWNRYRLKIRSSEIIASQKTELEKLNKQLIELNKTKDKFFSIIAHDLRNPFNTIIAYSSFLINSFEELSTEEIVTSISEINKSSLKTYHLLENLLFWAKSQTGTLKVEKSKISLQILAEENIKMIHESARLKNIRVINSIDKDIIVSADKFMISTIIRNLLSNAIKFTGDNGIIELTCGQNEMSVYLKIKDSGAGMSKETLDKLFDLDPHKSLSSSNKEKGSGLGLVLCKEFAEMNGGTIIAKSELGIGSEFIVTLNSG